MSEVVAVLCSDFHASHVAPKLRRAKPNWYGAMLRTIEQVRAIVEEHKCPLVFAGDLFDAGWQAAKCPPELLNFMIKYWPRCYGIPGQHDLPHHRYSDIEKSAYWTLVEAGIIHDLPPGVPVEVGGLALHGFPWGSSTKPPSPSLSGALVLHVAVIHHYAYFTKGTAHVGASDDDRIHLGQQARGIRCCCHRGQSRRVPMSARYLWWRLCVHGLQLRDHDDPKGRRVGLPPVRGPPALGREHRDEAAGYIPGPIRG